MTLTPEVFAALTAEQQAIIKALVVEFAAANAGK